MAGNGRGPARYGYCGRESLSANKTQLPRLSYVPARQPLIREGDNGLSSCTEQEETPHLEAGVPAGQRHSWEDMKVLHKLLRDSVKDRAELLHNALGVRTGTKGKNYWGGGIEAIKIISICFSLLSVAGTNTMTKSNLGGNDLFDLHSQVTIHH